MVKSGNAYFSKLKRKIYQSYHKMHEKENGKYYIIYRKAGFVGIGSHIISNLSHFKYAEDNGLIPVVDMEYFHNIYLESSEFCRKNAWDYYFEQPVIGNMSLHDVYSSGDFRMSSGDPLEVCPNDSMEFLEDEEARMYWHNLYLRYMPVKDEVVRLVEDFSKAHFEPFVESGEKIAGVLLRGTDYLALRPNGHPVQPTIEQAITKIHELQKSLGFSKLFIVTEDKAISDAIVDEFGDVVILPEDVKYNYSGEGYIGYVEDSRENDKYLHGREYLESILLLTKCNFLIAGRTSGSVAAHILGEGFEKEFFFDLGRY